MGEGLQGRPVGYRVIRMSWRGGHKPYYLITTAEISGDARKEKHTCTYPVQQGRNGSGVVEFKHTCVKTTIILPVYIANFFILKVALQQKEKANCNTKKLRQNLFKR